MRCAASDSVNASVLDFGGITGALILKDNANVTFNNITLMGAGPQNLSDPNADTKLKASGLGIWPLDNRGAKHHGVHLAWPAGLLEDPG